MAQEDPAPRLDEQVLRLIDQKVRQLIRRHVINAGDAEDLAQEMTLRLWRRLQRFNPRRASRRTFVRLALNSITASLLSRPRSRYLSLQTPVTTTKGKVELAALLDLDAGKAHLGRYVPDPLEQVRMAADVADVLVGLLPSLRLLAEQLKIEKVTQVAREHGVPRSTLQYQVRQLREIFEQRGLGPFSDNLSSFSRDRG